MRHFQHSEIHEVHGRNTLHVLRFRLKKASRQKFFLIFELFYSGGSRISHTGCLCLKPHKINKTKAWSLPGAVPGAPLRSAIVLIFLMWSLIARDLGTGSRSLSTRHISDVSLLPGFISTLIVSSLIEIISLCSVVVLYILYEN